MPQRVTFERVIASAFAVATFAIAAALVKREFGPGPGGRPPGSAAGAPVSYVSDWREIAEIGIRVGAEDAPVTIIEFTDFQCPACRSFHQVYLRLVDSVAHVSLVYVPYPLASHYDAVDAAKGAECAHDQGAFMPFATELFRYQRHLGVRTWESFAEAGGVADLRKFNSCVADTVGVGRITAAKEIARRIGVTGTPTLIVNGWRLAGLPPEAELRRIVESIVGGREPFDASGGRID